MFLPRLAPAGPDQHLTAARAQRAATPLSVWEGLQYTPTDRSGCALKSRAPAAASSGCSCFRLFVHVSPKQNTLLEINIADVCLCSQFGCVCDCVCVCARVFVAIVSECERKPSFFVCCLCVRVRVRSARTRVCQKNTFASARARACARAHVRCVRARDAARVLARAVARQVVGGARFTPPCLR